MRYDDLKMTNLKNHCKVSIETVAHAWPSSFANNLRNNHMIKERGKSKFERLNIVQHQGTAQHKKPKIRFTSEQIKAVNELKSLLRDRELVTVCEEASAPT